MPDIRVIHILRGSPFYGGQDIYVTGLARFGSAHGLDVRVVVLATSPGVDIPLCRDLVTEGLPHIVVPAPERFRPVHVRHVAEIIDIIKPDLIHIHEYKSGLIGLAAGRITGITTVATAHGWTWNSARAVAYEAIERGLLHGFARIVVGTAAMERSLEQARIPDRKIRRVAHPVWLSDSPSKHDFIGPRQRYGVPEDALLLGTLGRLSREKGQADLIRALVKVHDQAPDVHLLLGGDGVEQGSLAALSSDLALDDHVHFLGTVPHNEIGEFLKEIDIFVLPSRRDNLPLSLLEAMAAAVPVVATAVGGIPDLIRDGETGYLTQPADPTALVAALKKAIENSSTRLKIGKMGRETVLTAHSPETFAKQISTVYKELVS